MYHQYAPTNTVRVEVLPKLSHSATGSCDRQRYAGVLDAGKDSLRGAIVSDGSPVNALQR